MLRKLICVGLLSMAATASLSGQPPVKQKPALSLPAAAEAASDVEFIEGKVLLVIDGDQFRVKTADGVAYTIRLHGIDAPEDLQPFGPEARKALEELALNKDVRIVVHRRDSQGRHVGTAYIDGHDVAVKQIERGNAWHYKRFGGEQSADARMRYSAAEVKARDSKKGLWVDEMPVPPWEYRESLAGATKDDKPLAHPEIAVPAPAVESSPGNNTSDRKYIMGPRGGCYYLSQTGVKIYVKDKSLCTTP